MKRQIIRFAYAHRSPIKRLRWLRRPVLLKLRDFQIYVRLDDWAVGARIAVRRSYEPHVTAAMRPLLRPGTVLVDIGANIGYYSLFAASQIQPAGKVIAFEPSQDNCALLRVSLQANHFDNVVLYPYAVADVDGVVGFGMDDSNGRISRDDPGASPYQVQALTLDTFLADEPRIDIIKMDIEGAEGRALHGMRALVRAHRPIIFTELNPHGLELASSISAGVYLDHLRELGYRLYVVSATGYRRSIPQSNEQILNYFAQPGASDHLDLIAYSAEEP